jgi:hypothetical protein
MIPFSWLPAAWGLKGKTREIAKAEYEIKDPRELAEKLLLIKYDVETEGETLDYQLEQLDIRLKFESEYSQEQYEHDKLNLKFPDKLDTEYLERKSLLELAYKRITQSEYDRTIATLHNRPYVSVDESGFDINEGPGGFWMNFEWNEPFIDFLREHGYVGFDDQQVFNSWLADIYRSQILETELQIAPDEKTEIPEDFSIRETYLGNGKVEYD